MYVLLPFASLKASAEWWPDAGLVRAVQDCYLIAMILRRAEFSVGPQDRFANTSQVQMWFGHRFALCEHGRLLTMEWKKRGYECPAMHGFFLSEIETLSNRDRKLRLPRWLGSPFLHVSHQSTALRMFPDAMQKWVPDVPATFPTLWPHWDQPSHETFTLFSDPVDRGRRGPTPQWMAKIGRTKDITMPRPIKGWEAVAE